ncbi:hypothetical protein A2982_04155 [candidate division WWE3 bacterium RIFCSPLOWO2_01_FULL_39_13]|uniref:Uncharacterized protein n=1 Tax=candidate division WWE3 bacterium RIFCSPLOWO2_01_FULL_39_13 TaxID=1802624 RepID=A0A1F4V248_UNCKA|nr:MAG: hypothetical protein A2982_04155 [candidate division WWE3 bacterium RIFCSPLOWO2_01_FULL_39_13]
MKFALVKFIKKIIKRKNLVFIWLFVNSPLFLLSLTLVIGNFYLPKLLTKSQLRFQDELRINEAKHEYSISLLNKSWKRLFMAKNFYWNSRLTDFDEGKDQLWDEYYDSVKDWNVSLVGNFFTIEKYYDKNTRDYFEEEVSINFIKLHDELLKIRNGELSKSADIDKLLELLDNRMYILAEKLYY